MSSILKILVDIPCLVYCDFEQVGEAFPNSIFKMELRKGTYIIEFKKDGVVIESKEYIMKSDNEEDLLRINLSIALSKYKREQECLKIANINADIQYKDEDWWIVNKDNGCRIRLLYNLEDYSHSNRNSFDMVGLRSVSIGGEEVDYWGYSAIEGGKWGCINKQGEMQIPAIYDKSIYFYNDKVANAFLDGKGVLIDKYGEQVYNDLYDSLKGDFFQNQIVCKNDKFGVIDTNGKYIIPVIYDNLERIDGDNTRFIIKVNNKYGIISHNNHLLLPCIYDTIVRNKYVFSVCSNNKWGVFDYNLKSIVSTEYEILVKDDNCNDKRPILVSKNGYYGILNINISKPDDICSWDGKLKHIFEIVPCIYNALYNEYGQEIEPCAVSTSFLDRFYFVDKDQDTLHCYKYGLQKFEEVNSLPIYTAINIKEFVCESFKLVDECLVFTNRDISTITVGETQLNIKLDGQKLTKIISLPQGNTHFLQVGKDVWVYENNKLTGTIENVKLGELISLPQGNKYLLQIGKDLWVFEKAQLIECVENATLCEHNGVVYGVKKNGKFAIYTPEFVQCTPFEYDSLSVPPGIYYDNGIVEFSIIVDNRRLYGEYSCETKSVISYGFLREKNIRSHYNWAEKYDPQKRKEGIISFNPKSVIVPFINDYIRFYTGKKSTVFVVSKEFDNYPQKRYALMSTTFELLTDYIFKKIEYRDWGGHGYLNDMHFDLIYNDEVYSNFDLSLNDIERFAPFLGFEHDVVDEYDEYNRPRSLHNEAAESPFKNIRLFIDTETTGLPINDKLPYTKLDNWPYLVQVALIIEDDNYGVLARRNIILKPDGYIIPESSTKVHGISNEKAIKDGEDRNKVLSFLDIVLYNSDIIIGHNVSFDLNVIKSEIIRIKGMENTLFSKKHHSVIDTMKIGMDICKLPNLSFYSRRSQPYKYPKLDELYYKLFNKRFDNQHDAMADVQATYDCYYELKGESV